MQWKKDVTVVKRDGEWYLNDRESSRQVAGEDVPVVEAMEQGICDGKELVHYLAEKQKKSEVVAGLYLAQFMVEYIDYIDYIGISEEEVMIEP